MALTSPVSCLFDDFSSYCVSFYLIYLYWCHLMNYISLKMNLKMMGLDPALYWYGIIK